MTVNGTKERQIGSCLRSMDHCGFERSLMSLTTTRRGFIKGGAGLSLAAAASLYMAGCSGPAGEGKVLRYGCANPKVSLDLQTNTSNEIGVAESICEPLIRFNEKLEMEPVLLTKMPEISADGLTYTFELKDKLPVHDGSNLTANDVKFTFTRMFLPSTKNPSTNVYDTIVGAKDVMDGKTEELAGLTVQDDTHFTIVLESVQAIFLPMLTEFYALIYPEAACKAAGDSWGTGTNFVGTGPSKLTAESPTGLTLETFADYHGGPAKIDGIEVSYVDDPNTLVMNYKAGQIDLCNLAPSLYDQYVDDEEVAGSIVAYTPASTRFVNLNLHEDMFKDPRVRQALSLAINRDELVNTVLQGASTACSQFCAPGEEGHDDSLETLAFDPDKAKALLADAGVSNLAFDFPVRSRDEVVATALQEYWRNIGVTANISIMDDGMWVDQRAAGALPCTLITWTTLCWIGAEHMRSFFYSSKASQRSSFYDSPTFDSLVDEAEATMDAAKRTDLTLQADNQLVNVDFGTIPVDWPQTPYLKDEDFSGIYRVYDFKFTNQLA